MLSLGDSAISSTIIY